MGLRLVSRCGIPGQGVHTSDESGVADGVKNNVGRAWASGGLSAALLGSVFTLK